MAWNPDEQVIVWRGGSERDCAELSLVLTARGIEHRRIADGSGFFLLVVPAADARRAGDEIRAYRAEHAAAPPPMPPPLREHAGAWTGVAAYASVLMLFAILTEQAVLGVDWRRAGMLIAGDVIGSEWWRAITALTLHSDTVHLASNLAFGGFFGFFLGRYFGPGVAWLAILLAGFIGNALNAAIQPADHRSIGASTAVFGALGLLTAYTWRRGPGHGSLRARLAPIVAGIALLAFTGTGGEQTDIFAHLTGFAAGFGLGALLLHKLDVSRVRYAQAIAGAVAIGLLAVSWVLALAVV
ncbi:MAG TPA: rhomboid family intramembrane serine protease [Gammaproteobacteria bacterium]